MYLWDGNVPLHEWKTSYERAWDNEKECEYRKERRQPLVTWIFEEGTFVPATKIVNNEYYNIISDYLGTPNQAYRNDGALVWERELNSYGATRDEKGLANFIPFKYQGQYYDNETGLAYNRFRYYDPGTGNYISQDPIRLAGDNPTIYGYVSDTNTWIDIYGLDCTKNKKTSYEGVSRRDAFRQAKRDADIPVSQQPTKIYREPLLDGKGNKILDKNGNVIETRNYQFANNRGETIVIQEHNLGHPKSNPGDAASKPHFNVRPITNTQTGHVDSTHGHYNF